MSCEHAHDHVAVHGRCTGCGQIVSYAGPFDTDPDSEGGVRWRTSPWIDHTDETCRVFDGGHRPDTANGSCGSCPTQLDAFRDPESDQLRWFETVY